jgi:hypothetical protein
LSDRVRLHDWGEFGFRKVCNYDYSHASKGLESALEAVAAERK